MNLIELFEDFTSRLVDDDEKLFRWYITHQNELKDRLDSYFRANKELSPKTVKQLLSKTTLHELEKIESSDLFLETLGEVFNDIVEDVMENFPNILPDEKLPIFRSIMADTEMYLAFARGEKDAYKHYTSLGVCWAFDPERAEAHFGGSNGHCLLLSGMIDLNSCNIASTMELWLHPSIGFNEAEIRLKEGCPVFLSTVTDETTNTKHCINRLMKA